jgi:hypothetical protein
MTGQNRPSDPRIRIFGVRHHGPGSARSLLQALEAWQPDAVLIEGPPEANDLLDLANRPEMEPPVALLVYVPDEPHRAGFFPFARFSPEWQALGYSLRQGIATRFIDLPQRHWLAMQEIQPGQEVPAAEPPLDRLARAAGFEDGDRWWEYLVEERRVVGEDIFAAILEMMTEVRSEVERDPQAAAYNQWLDPLGPQREASMRKAIRSACREGFERIAVVCGAWHAPALVKMPSARSDNALLKGLPRVKVRVTWVPWSYGHLSRASGYGAGVTSPGWYDHLWTTAGQTTARWLGRVAHLLRDEDMDASAAQVIDAVRLAEALAALRSRPRPGLQEMNEASLAVFCFGNPLPLQIIQQRLIIGDRLGQVPPDTPLVPLQQDLAALQRRLRLPPRAEAKDYDLDLRKPNGLARSHLLHRLRVLGIPWGQPKQVDARKMGTFHEYWTLQWRPAFAVLLIEAAVWGNTVLAAAAAKARHLAETAPDLAALTALLELVILADLPQAVDQVVRCLQAQTALSGDVAGLTEALPPLARAQRYGTVRQMAGTEAVDADAIASLVDSLVTRICIGLPLACASLDDDAGRQMLLRLEAVHAALMILQFAELLKQWNRTLEQLADQQGLHGLLAGRCTRLLHDQGIIDPEGTARRLGLALSPANDPAQAAYWLEGLLRGSGLLLLHDQALWETLDVWVAELSGEAFTAVLPLLRRTFSEFSTPERRYIGERVRKGPGTATGWDRLSAEVDVAQADQVLPLLAQLLDLEDKEREDYV